ncbi:MAG: hypothetical protein M0R50_09085 [Candidatus Cloacimonetes bacterium]|jgi:hypothetical protein|nr:hypothetical protein [Candidatus Cloacimonadota bacterium]
MLFLKSLLFIVWNIALGLAIVYFIRWYLFNNRHHFSLGKHIVLCPGLLVRKRDWLFTKARDLLFDYIRQAENPGIKDGYLAKWEQKVRDYLWEKTDFVESWPLMPAKMKQSIRTKIVDAFTGIVSRLLRKTVPRLLEQWRVEHRIDDYDFQFSIEFFLKYHNLYVHKYLVYVFLVLNFIIGVENMILYLIIG